jgi:glyoxylase-like metal-dependent hydrolase (beta-lactamase superfamily II)
MINLTWRIGDFTITKVVETEGTGPNGGSESALADAWPAAIVDIPWLIPDFATPEGHLCMSVHALLIETPNKRLIVDTCIGNDKTRALPHFDHLHTGFLEDLEAAGWPRESVDAVVCTHLHVDHVGWNTMLVDGKWIPTFPRAEYFMVRAEVDHLERQAGSDNADLSAFAGAMMDPGNVYNDSVRPVIEGGRAILVEPDAELAPGVRLLPTPGHTPGHVSVHLESGGESAVITGDMMHHPCQIARPQWCSAFDDSPAQSVATRLAFFERFADTPTLIIGTHFGGPTAGRLVRGNEGYELSV